MIRIATLIAGLALGALSMSAADLNIDEQKITLQAKNARTTDEHKAVARLYEQRAAAFEAKAKSHEAQADSLASNKVYNPMKYKWPAMVQAPIDRERAKAMQARRAARESMELMAQHQRLADNAAVTSAAE